MKQIRYQEVLDLTQDRATWRQECHRLMLAHANGRGDWWWWWIQIIIISILPIGILTFCKQRLTALPSVAMHSWHCIMQLNIAKHWKGACFGVLNNLHADCAMFRPIAQCLGALHNVYAHCAISGATLNVKTISLHNVWNLKSKIWNLNEKTKPAQT